MSSLPGRSWMTNKIIYRGYRFPPEIIQRAVWLYYSLAVPGNVNVLVRSNA